MTDNQDDLDQWYQDQRLEQALNRLAVEYGDDDEHVDELELLRRLTRASQQPGHARHGQPDGSEALDGLVVYRGLAAELDLHQLRLIKAALEAGERFPAIGAALGLTDDGARARWRNGRHRIESDTER